jgi:hypothetical protein
MSEPTIIDGKVWVPMIPTPETDGTIGDAMRELSPDDPDYDAILWWCLFLVVVGAKFVSR